MTSFTHSFTSRGNFLVANPLTCILGGGRKLENLEETQIDTQRTSDTLHTVDSKDRGTLDQGPWSCDITFKI